MHDRLVAAVSIVPSAKLLAWSPTNAKAYTQPSAALKVKEHGRTKSYRVDVVFAVSHVLVLAESKGRSSESDEDIKKLRSIRNRLDLNEVI